MVSKTRQSLIEAAQLLFARKGVENTTMADIAEASSKGRRTLYTYFKTKREIQQAVVEQQTAEIMAAERSILSSNISAVAKLEKFLLNRLDVLEKSSFRIPQSLGHKSMRTLLENSRMLKAQRMVAPKEVEIFQAIVAEGVANGEFTSHQADRVAPLVLLMLFGVANPTSVTTLESAGYSRRAATMASVRFILEALQASKPGTQHGNTNT